MESNARLPLNRHKKKTQSVDNTSVNGRQTWTIIHIGLFYNCTAQFATYALVTMTYADFSWRVLPHNFSKNN